MSNLYDRCLSPSLAQLADEVNQSIDNIPRADFYFGLHHCPHCDYIIPENFYKLGISKCDYCGEVYQI